MSLEVNVSNALTLVLRRNSPLESFPPRAPEDHERQIDQEFRTMRRAFRRSGGISHGDEIARRVSEHADQPISKVARWIVNNEALAFEWNGQTMLPLFQFDPCSMSLRPGIRLVLRELWDVFDNW